MGKPTIVDSTYIINNYELSTRIVNLFMWSDGIVTWKEDREW